jgi:hypothetical protein
MNQLGGTEETAGPQPEPPPWPMPWPAGTRRGWQCRRCHLRGGGTAIPRSCPRCRGLTVVDVTQPFWCPRCSQSSRSVDDQAEGYCPRCHWYTGDPELGQIEPPNRSEPRRGGGEPG